MLPSRLSPLVAILLVVAAACGSSSTLDEAASAPDSESDVAAAAAEVNPLNEGAPATIDARGADEFVTEVANEPMSTVPALDPPLEPVGVSTGPATQRAQNRLLELGFWVQEASGVYGVTTTQAVMAFQKHYGLATDGVLGPITAQALSDVTERPTGRSTTGTLVEVDKNKQLVYVIRDGATEWILNASTGSEIPYEEEDQNTPDAVQIGDSRTRPGLFEVYREREEGWWEGDLGEIYRPKYFNWGIALHGSNSVPDYPASHGCVRLSIPAMDWIWDDGIVPMGTPVWVHGELAEEFQYDPTTADEDADTDA